MASITLSFTFDTGSNGWYQDSLNRWYWDSATGNPGGGLVLSTSGRETLNSYLFVPATYEALGIPAGSIITGFRDSRFDSIALSYPGSTTNMRVGALTASGQTLVPQRTYTAASSWGTNTQPAAITGLSIASSTAADLRLYYVLARGTGFQNPSLAIDNIYITIDYLPPASATLNATESGSDSMAASASAAPLSVTATLNATEQGADSLVATLAVQNRATLNATELGADSLVATLAVQNRTALNATEQGTDNMAASASALASLALSATEQGADTFAASASALASLALNATELGTDSLVATLAVQNHAALNATELGADSLVATLAVQNRATLSATEQGVDTFAASASATPSVNATLSVTEQGTDSFAANASTLASLALNTTEQGADSFAANGTLGPVPMNSTLSVTEQGADSFAANASALASLALGATEQGADSLAASGNVIPLPVNSTLSVTEQGADSFAANTSVLASMALSATEQGADSLATSGNVISLPVNATLSATEQGTDSLVASGNVIPFPSGLTVAAVEAGSDQAAVVIRKLQRTTRPTQQNQDCPMPDYLQYITTEHRKPKFEATVSAITQPLSALQQLLCRMPTEFDVDVAIGVQLDAVGVWVGRSRFISTPLPNVYFSWDDTAEKGWDQGVWKGEYDPDSGLTSLPDDTYRTLLKAKIAANHWDGTIPGAYAVWREAYTTSTLIIQDMQDMSMIIGITGQPLSAVDRAIITQGYIPLKPEGVRIRYYAVSPAIAPLFALDVDTSDTLAGLGIGYWPEILAA